MPAVRTWLGAGVLAAGMGVAVVGAAGVAQADSGAHSAAGSASTSKTNAGPSAGSKRAAVGSPKPAGASTRPSPATAKPAAASPAAVLPPTTITREGGASVNTPVGPITVSVKATLPLPFTEGPLALSLKANTPLGNIAGSLAGSQAVTPGLPPINTLTFDQGNLVVPAGAAFLVSALGPGLTAGASLSHSSSSFTAAAQRGDVGGALLAVLSAAPNVANAILFGRETFTLPLVSSINGDAQSVQLHVPVGGWFAPLAPLSASWTDYTYVDQSGLTYKVNGGEIEFTGTKFGGAVPAFFALFA